MKKETSHGTCLVIYVLNFGYTNDSLAKTNILRSNDILSQKYIARVQFKSSLNSTLVNHDNNNVHYSATKSLLLNSNFLFLIEIL